MSYLSSSPTEIYFAIQGLQTIQGISVEWPSGVRCDISPADFYFTKTAKTWFVQIQEPRQTEITQEKPRSSVTILPFP